jgi:hydroxymethylbilane synthase
VTPVRIGSRGSALALWQANHIRGRLRELHCTDSEIVIVRTTGDRFQNTAIPSLDGKGVFIKELEDALLDGLVDIAVHSMKDVPTATPHGLLIAAMPPRDEPWDCLVARGDATLDNLPAGARVATSSLRRQSQLRRLRPDLEVIEIRGNVDTRLHKLDEGQCDALILAKAGLDRLGLGNRASEVLSPEVMLPAVGQGALGIEARVDDAALLALLAPLEHSETRICVSAERALLASLEGGCQLPLGAWGRVIGGELHLDACVLSADGSEYLRQGARGPADAPEKLGLQLGLALRAAGAGHILHLAGRVSG